MKIVYDKATIKPFEEVLTGQVFQPVFDRDYEPTSDFFMKTDGRAESNAVSLSTGFLYHLPNDVMVALVNGYFTVKGFE